MPDLYLIIVSLLILIAILDLVVGVSNDAVNFLNSSIGSKVAPRKIIMIVASLGILIGATFSSGMMEVARKGIFHPEFFFLSEIMIIFLAVMITDIILLDLFNTFGMPTSTTVSIVFELLGAAVAISILKIMALGDPISTLDQYINTSSAILIISGIFLSVIVAFLVGSIVQYFSRLLFTFQVDKRLRWVGGIWAGLALSALTYFLLIKGVKGASFISDGFLAWVKGNTLLLLGISFIFWSLVMQACITFFKLNILRFVVLFGTFALAMAFAGNDLVNFIGVPIAGLESYTSWSTSGVAAEDYAMTSLNEPVRTQTILLVIAGLIMVATLWFSKKARSVTETEVNLSRQDEGSERFQPGVFSKAIVRYALLIGKGFSKVLPSSWTKKAERSFHTPKAITPPADSDYDPPAFDLVRASVNLTMASVLIAFATSLKLPLSTTYVSFMVAMGTSLSDRAWGRSSAVFRISGVLNVIGGWFLTAFSAFFVAALFATFMHFFGIWAIGALVLLAVLLISRTIFVHRKREKHKSRAQKFEKTTMVIPSARILEETGEKVIQTLSITRNIYQNAISGLLHEDRHLLKEAEHDIQELQEENQLLKQQLFYLIQRIDEDDVEASRTYLQVYDLEQDLVQSVSLIVDTCTEYVGNSLEPINGSQGKRLRELHVLIGQYFTNLEEVLKQSRFEGFSNTQTQKEHLIDQIDLFLSDQVRNIKNHSSGMRNSLLYFNILLETKDLIDIVARFARLYRRTKPKQLEIESF